MIQILAAFLVGLTLVSAQPLTMGPFGGGGDASFADSVASGVSSITVTSGAWINSIQVGYRNGSSGPFHGGQGGGVTTQLILAQGEYIVGVSGRSGAYVDQITFTTSSNRSVVLGPADSGAQPFTASACPEGAYYLAEIQGTSGDYLSSVTFVWRKLSTPLPPSGPNAADEGWQCLPGLPWLLRPGSANITNTTGYLTPQCLATDGACWQGNACAYQLLCSAKSFTPKAMCNKLDDNADPTQDCPRAQAVVEGNARLPASPITNAIFILDVCDSGPACAATDLKTALYDDPYALAKYWPTISLGRAKFDNTTSVVAQVKLPCGTFNKSVCQFNDWVNYIDQNAATLLPSLPSYKFRRTFIVPNTGACGDIGFWDAPNTYVRGDLVVVGNTDYLNVFKHELGHSLDLSHSSFNGEEYGDGSSPMGYCQRCSYAAPHLLQLGWAAAVASLSANTLPANNTRSFVVPALATAYHSVLHIRTDWTDTPNTIYVSLRVAQGQDVGLPAKFNGTLSVHSVAGLGANTQLLITIAPGEEWVDSQSGLKVRHEMRSNMASLVIVSRGSRASV